MEKSMILKTKDYLKQKYNCHSIILYGSFVNETYTKESDIDMMFSSICSIELILIIRV